MAGSDQSRNLGGMLSQIGTTLGTQGESYRANLGQNITNITRPDLNLEDPDSMQKYMNWAVGTGSMTEGQATQMQWQIQKLREAQTKKKEAEGARGLVTGFRNIGKTKDAMSAELASLQTLQIDPSDAAALAQRDAGIATKTQNIQTLDQNLTAMEAAITANPTATKLRFDEDKMMYDRQKMEDYAVASEVAKKEAAELEQFNAMSNGLTSAVLTGQLNIQDPENQSVKAIAANYPKVFEDVTKRSEVILKRQIAMKKDTGELNAEMLDEDYFSDLPAGTYENYKKAYGALPNSANNNAIALRKSYDLEVAKNGLDTKDADTAKRTGFGFDLTSTTGRAQAQAIGSTILTDLANNDETLQGLIQANSKGNSNGARALSGLIMSEMEADGLPITTESMQKYITDTFTPARVKQAEADGWSLAAFRKWWNSDDEQTDGAQPQAPAEATPTQPLTTQTTTGKPPADSYL